MNRRMLILLAASLFAAPCVAGGVAPISLTDLNGKEFAFPANLPSPRTLVVVAFKHADQAIVQGWKSGLALDGTQDDWLEVPVVGVTSGMVKAMIRSGMRGKYPDARDKAHVAPLFGDAATYAKDLGISPDNVAVLVIDRQGHVLASASGAYSDEAAAAIRRAWRLG